MRRVFRLSLILVGIACFAVPFASAQQFTGEIDLERPLAPSPDW